MSMTQPSNGYQAQIDELRRRQDDINRNVEARFIELKQDLKEDISQSNTSITLSVDSMAAEMRILTGQALDRRMSAMEDNLKWLVRTVVGAFIIAGLVPAVIWLMSQSGK
jgi:hypothetical protein